MARMLVWTPRTHNLGMVSVWTPSVSVWTPRTPNVGQNVGVNLENSEDGQMFVMEFQRHA